MRKTFLIILLAFAVFMLIACEDRVMPEETQKGEEQGETLRVVDVFEGAYSNTDAGIRLTPKDSDSFNEKFKVVHTEKGLSVYYELRGDDKKALDFDKLSLNELRFEDYELGDVFDFAGDGIVLLRPSLSELLSQSATENDMVREIIESIESVKSLTSKELELTESEEVEVEIREDEEITHSSLPLSITLDDVGEKLKLYETMYGFELYYEYDEKPINKQLLAGYGMVDGMFFDWEGTNIKEISGAHDGVLLKRYTPLDNALEEAAQTEYEKFYLGKDFVKSIRFSDKEELEKRSVNQQKGIKVKAPIKHDNLDIEIVLNEDMADEYYKMYSVIDGFEMYFEFEDVKFKVFDAFLLDASEIKDFPYEKDWFFDYDGNSFLVVYPYYYRCFEENGEAEEEYSKGYDVPIKLMIKDFRFIN